MLHELTHAKLHTVDNLGKYKTHEKEFQAELTAYTVCSHFGIDTSEYSLQYLNSWIKDKELNDKKELLKEVRETAVEYIETLENVLLDKDLLQEKAIDEIKESKEPDKSKDDEFMKEYLENQRRKSIGQARKKERSKNIER